jgi:predicted dinucleotide-binding enzyme
MAHVSLNGPIAVLGTGNVGRALAQKWVQAGHHVLFAGRDSQRTEAAAAEAGAEPATPTEAIAAATVIVAAVPSSGFDDLAAALVGAREGAIIIDATNGRIDGRPAAISARELIEGAAPQASYVRAFNSTSWQNMVEPELDGHPIDMLWAGPEGHTGAIAEGLIRDVGMRPVRIGDASKTAMIDPLTDLWFTLVYSLGHGPRIAWTVSGLPT